MHYTLRSKIFWLSTLWLSSSAFTANDWLEQAVDAAQKLLPEERCQIVADKFAFLQTLSSLPMDTFHVVDVAVLVDRLQVWQKHLPHIVPHYAVKTNNDPIIISVLAALGTGFDCASEKELEQTLSLGVDPSKIIFAHPRKTNASIRYAQTHGVNLMTFDSFEELEKMQDIHPQASFLLRIKTDDSHSVIPLSQKFGATLEEAYAILDKGFANHAPITGVAFHVGSNCTDADSYEQAILESAELFRYSQANWNQTLQVLDLGGGWPGTDDQSFIQIANRVQQLLERYFSPETRFIAEPGRYFAAQTTTLAMKVIGKKSQQDKIAYYLSNGIYGFFMSSLYYEHNLEKILTEGWQIKPLSSSSKPARPSLLWGPTCDAGDKILDGVMLPEIETGEFFTVENLGAYSKSLETGFNSIIPSKPYYICQRPLP